MLAWECTTLIGRIGKEHHDTQRGFSANQTRVIHKTQEHTGEALDNTTMPSKPTATKVSSAKKARRARTVNEPRKAIVQPSGRQSRTARELLKEDRQKGKVSKHSKGKSA